MIQEICLKKSVFFHQMGSIVNFVLMSYYNVSIILKCLFNSITIETDVFLCTGSKFEIPDDVQAIISKYRKSSPLSFKTNFPLLPFSYVTIFHSYSSLLLLYLNKRSSFAHHNNLVFGF